MVVMVVKESHLAPACDVCRSRPSPAPSHGRMCFWTRRGRDVWLWDRGTFLCRGCGSDVVRQTTWAPARFILSWPCASLHLLPGRPRSTRSRCRRPSWGRDCWRAQTDRQTGQYVTASPASCNWLDIKKKKKMLLLSALSFLCRLLKCFYLSTCCSHWLSRQEL